ncbi:STAS domain-containing protein [Streptomyces sp. NPDC055287]
MSEDITLVKVTLEEMDVYTAPRIRQALWDLVNQGRHCLVVDLTAIEYLDSTGLGVLVGALKRIRAHDGSMALVVSSENVLSIFRTTGLATVFSRFDTVDRAVEFLGRESPGTQLGRRLGAG